MALPFSLKSQHVVHDSYVPKLATTAMIGQNLNAQKPLLTNTSLQ
jgi:hypothetical protein